MNKKMTSMRLVLALLLLPFAFYLSPAQAQSPTKMSYQAVIRNSSNALVVSHAVGMRISILQGSISGTEVYSETLTPTTNANGLVTIEIGGGNGFDNIDWASGPYFIKTETDPTGGTTYTITGVNQLLSVPYALHSKTADSLIGGITETDPVFGISIAVGITSTDTTNWNSKLDHYTETDPIFGTSVAAGITGTDTSNWNNKIDHYTETDPLFGTSVAAGITGTDTSNWNNKSEFDGNYSSLTNAPDIANTTNEKTIQLNSNDSTSSVNITKNNGTSVFNVDGTGRMTGDGSGLSNVKSLIAYAGGNSDVVITSYNPYIPTLVKYVEITVPGPGIILTQATGYIQWKSTSDDYCRMSIISDDIATNTANFGNNYFSYLMLSGDHNLTDSIDEYNNFAYSRIFTVSAAGTYRYNLWADKGYARCYIQIADANMQVLYFPTGGTGKDTDAIKEKEIIVPVNPNSLDGN